MQKNILPPAGFTQKLSASQHYEYNFLPFSCSILRAIQLWQAALVVVLNWSVCSKGLRYNIERMVKWEQWNQTADISWVLCDSAKRIRPSKFTTQLKPASTDGQKEKWQFEWDSHPKKKGGGPNSCIHAQQRKLCLYETNKNQNQYEIICEAYRIKEMFNIPSALLRWEAVAVSLITT